MEDNDEVPGGVFEGPTQWDEEVERPKEGMTFCSEEEAYSYYKKYASTVGFGVRRSNTKVGGDRKLKYFSIACSRSRKPASTMKTRKNSSTRTDCKAKINLIVDTDRRLIVSKVRLDHNHALGLGKALNGVHRTERNDQTSVIWNGSSHLLNSQQGGYENLQHGERTFKYYIKNSAHLPLGVGDAEAIQDFFSRMQRKDANFCHVIDLNEEGRLRNVFWVDARSRAAYETFGDVILFDTTYLIEKFDLPFVSFTGVNHHGHSILFGCGLLSSEDTETYIWLFRSWLSCMKGHLPKAIITDHSKVIQDAVSDVFPNVRHRLCLWHIMKKLPEQFGVYAQCLEIKKCFKCAVYESLMPDEFEENWKKMIDVHNLLNNVWLQSLYVERHHWVPVFVKGTFWAGLSMTQRSEVVEAFFGGFVNSKTSLKQFLEQYDNALRNKVVSENKADFASMKTSVTLVSDLSIEKQFREVYTHENFKLFQEELKGLLYCNTSFVKAEESFSTYEVSDSVKIKDGRSRRQVSFDVLYNEVKCEVQCTCHLFEFKGIICRHAIAVLMKKNVNEVPCCYILARWRKDIKRSYTLVKCSYDDFSTNSQMQRYDHLTKYFYQVAEIGAKSQAKYKWLMEYLDVAKEKLLKNEFECGNSQPSQEPSTSFRGFADMVNGIPNSANWFLSPLQAPRRGHPLTTRKELMEEQTTGTKKTTANPITGINTVTAGNHQHFLRYHYIQMYPDQLNETRGAQLNNPYAIWQNSSPGGLLQQPGSFGPNGPSDVNFFSGNSIVKSNQGNPDSTQATDDDQHNSSLDAVENPGDEMTKL